jgi:hypothetical protein
MVAITVAVAISRLDHDDIAVAIPVTPAPVAIPMAVSVAHFKSDAANIDVGAFRDDHRLVGDDRRTGKRRGGQKRDSKKRKSNPFHQPSP